MRLNDYYTHLIRKSGPFVPHRDEALQDLMAREDSLRRARSLLRPR